MPTTSPIWAPTPGGRRHINDADYHHNARVCVIGLDLVEKLFPLVDPLDKEVPVAGIPFRVIGVMGSTFFSDTLATRNYATKLAENGVPESTMLALLGHMSRAMLERYSHIRMAAKREAAAGVRLHSAAPNPEVVPVKVPAVAATRLVQ